MLIFIDCLFIPPPILAASIIIIIMWCCQPVSSWPSLATRPFRPSLTGGLQGYILYRHRAVVYSFLRVVLPLLVHVKGSTGVRPYFSSSVSRSSSNLDSFCDGWLVTVQLLFCGVLPPGLVQYCSQHSCVIGIKLFSPYVLLASM